MMQPASKIGAVILGIVIALVILGAIILIPIYHGYNRAIGLEEAVKSNWGQVETQLQRRYDLVPNLVQTVKGYAKHEEEIFNNIANARTKYFQAQGVTEKVEASNQLERSLSRLLFLQEQYPNLKANENFLKLQDQLEGTENRIAVARTRYNEVVQNLNTYVRSFFGRYFAGMAGVKPGVYFQTPEGQKTAPKVAF
ncbi:MAG: LemA family protein [Phycisphaerae bacterium]